MLVVVAWCRLATHEFGDRFPSIVAVCFAAASLSTTGAFGDVVREVAGAELRSTPAAIDGVDISMIFSDSVVFKPNEATRASEIA